MNRGRYFWGVTVLVVVLGVFGIYEMYRAKAYKQGLEDTYNRAFFELGNYVDDIDTLLAKGMLATSAGEMTALSQELSVQASAAKACLAQLPQNEAQLEKTEKFLSQVGDYTYMLSRSLIDKKTISEEEYENLSALGSYAQSLNEKLSELTQKIYSGEFRFGDNANISIEKVAYAETSDPFSDIEKEFGEYPSLIYDGPFSEHIESMQPKMLENAREVTRDEAKGKIAKRFGVDAKNVSYITETENSLMNSYMFKVISGKDEITASITKKGGNLVYFLSNRRVLKEEISVEDAIKKAAEYLEKHGYDSMKNSYYEKANGVATINFAYKQNNTICYSDLIKVKVSLADGDIVGMEANGYIMNHHPRKLTAPALSIQEAMSKISSRLSIDSVNIALIPKDSKREVLCYEFKGTSGGRNFLIYINADNGNEEDIQILIESPDGILTI